MPTTSFGSTACHSVSQPCSPPGRRVRIGWAPPPIRAVATEPERGRMPGVSHGFQCSASGERATPTPLAPGHWSSAANSSAPDPVPRSSTVRGERPPKCATAASISVSESARGISTPGATRRLIVQKSREPVM